MATKNPNAPNSHYTPTNIPAPAGTAGPGTHYITVNGTPAIVHNGVVSVMTPQRVAHIQQQKQTGHNSYGWEHKK
jgi:hypothetical protein